MSVHQPIIFLHLLVSLFGMTQNVQAKSGLQKNKIFQVIETPVQNQSMTPYLLAEGKSVWMTWIEFYGEKAKNKRIRISQWQENKWSPPVTVVDSFEIMANWADFPKIQRGGDGFLYLHWLKSGSAKDSHGYLAFVSRSKDNGKTWENIGRLHIDKNENAEHGFVSMVPDKYGVRAFWLDGGKMSGHSGNMLLKTALIGKKVSGESVVDSNVCTCCGTAATSISQEPLIFYRDRSEKEIRDIYVAKQVNGKWKQKNVSADQWEIHGCPVNGPDVDSIKNNVVVAWYSGGGKHTGVKLAFSQDGGNSFSKAIPIDDFLVGSLGRVQVRLLNKEEALVTWMKSKSNGKADLYARRVHSSGRRGQAIIVAEIGSSRGVGFPQMRQIDDRLIMAWADDSGREYYPDRVKAITFNLSSIPKLEKEDSKQIPLTKTGFSKGEYIANLSAKDMKGNRTVLESFRGKTILLNYWASWCDACIEEFGYINGIEKKYASKGLKIVMINIDTEQDWPKAQKIIKHGSLKALVLRDPENNGASKFGYAALPYTALIDSHLKLRWTATGSLLGKKEELDQKLKRLLK